MMACFRQCLCAEYATTHVCYVCLQVEALLGMCADDLAVLKDGDSDQKDRYNAILQKAQWQEFVMRLATRTK